MYLCSGSEAHFDHWTGLLEFELESSSVMTIFFFFLLQNFVTGIAKCLQRRVSWGILGIGGDIY